MPNHLKTYLVDHAALTLAVLELAKRARNSNPEGELGEFLAEIIPMLEAERKTLKEMLRRIKASDSPLKNFAAWSGEKAGRFKLNDSLFTYSDLSRVVELEALLAGTELKTAMWDALATLAMTQSDFRDLDLDGYLRKNKTMGEKLRALHRTAAHRALRAEES
ncbi:hypothetical protein [Thioalkalivibrio sp. XN279]|uniref:hypothetical protein n=1 Tax=Thioalkalivibrio sp. XN279 TaxID=2714953 RepID=UPI00140AE3F5|nr:hypothetical protein [Thioalkalivibrio sp. XN279]NHA13991.1 hypothetical protein [Thioalkalivibrio sp. XN279]